MGSKNNPEVKAKDVNPMVELEQALRNEENLRLAKGKVICEDPKQVEEMNSHSYESVTRDTKTGKLLYGNAGDEFCSGIKEDLAKRGIKIDGRAK